ncbi:MAG TPA: glycosyltransferase family 2 protein [Syntrophales bacterium]|nr:glycosyltransferase family 2 protein [Syntrophales bacterium]
MTKREDIIAVVVTYFPDQGFPGRLDAILNQFDRALIVDNASAGESLAMLEDLCGTRDRLAMIRNDRNTGVAHALNQGCQYALEKRYPWAVTFDQDTVVSEGYLESMLEAASGLRDAGIGVIGCNYYEPNLGRNAIRSPDGSDREERAVVITSGSLLSLQAYQHVGGFRDEFFIDAVDEEYCLRCSACGFRNFLVLKPLMVHSIGNMKEHFLFGCREFKFVLHHHPSWRMYYFVRNNLILYGTYLLRRPSWVFPVAVVRSMQVVLILLFEEDRLRKLRYLIWGILDSITGNRHRRIL